MPAYPGSYISRDSSITPVSGVTTDFAEDLTIKQRNDAAGTRYQLRIIEDWISQADFDALVAAYAASLGPYDVTMKGQDFTAYFTGEPAIIDHRGNLYRVEVRMVAVAA